MVDRRSFDIVRPQMRAKTDEEGAPIGPGTFTGHASVFGQRTLIGDRSWGFVEEIAPGAFGEDVLSNDVRFLFNHDGQPLARTTNGTLRLSVDDEGLYNEADLADTSLGRDVALLVNRGDLTQQSFAFTVARDGADWSVLTDEETGMEMDLRTIHTMEKLYDTSVVTYPAYEGATGGMRSELHVVRADVEAIHAEFRTARELVSQAAAAEEARYEQLRNVAAKHRIIIALSNV